MNWKVKALVQGTFSVVPGGQSLNFQFQRHVTHGLPIPESKLDEKVALSQHHVAMLERYGSRPVAECVFFEFGAGWDLSMPLLLHCLGVDRQIVVDIRPLRRADLVFRMAERLRSKALPDRFVRRPDSPNGATLDGYLARHGITYRAPLDARHTDLAAGSVHAVTSTNTLEHIAGPDIAAILCECRRLLRADGVMSFQVDYQDHYSYFDRSASVYNFLRYGERQWRRYNPSLHFQNRLRNSQYHDLYDEGGFDVVAEETLDGNAADLATIATLPVAPEFRAFDPSDLAVRRSRVVLSPRSACTAS